MSRILEPEFEIIKNFQVVIVPAGFLGAIPSCTRKFCETELEVKVLWTVRILYGRRMVCGAVVKCDVYRQDVLL